MKAGLTCCRLARRFLFLSRSVCFLLIFSARAFSSASKPCTCLLISSASAFVLSTMALSSVSKCFCSAPESRDPEAASRKRSDCSREERTFSSALSRSWRRAPRSVMEEARERAAFTSVRRDVTGAAISSSSSPASSPSSVYRLATYSMLHTFSSSFTAWPFAAYSFLVLSLTPALLAICPAMLWRKSTRSSSDSMDRCRERVGS
mmetsp:Transcript_4806/g.9208  ORF Transcript_4806/g.9208 Transcript_4806/m.9208 type:complete len:205 (+) Transcript_4806:580-1194(+)